MNLFDSWFYQNILNTEWLVWGIIGTIFGFNFIAPVILWYALSETKFRFNPIRFFKKIMNQEESTGS